MAKVVITFQDGKDEQLISFFSDRGIDLNQTDMTTMTPAEQLAALSIQLLDEYAVKAGANVERILPKYELDGMN
jgi:hypothetical protein